MFAVVLGHVIVNNHIAAMDTLIWHIPGFLLITGYFGVTLSWRKVVKLLGTVYGCYWLTIPFRLGEDTLLSLLMPHGGWFLPFYLVLMLLSPLFNAILQSPITRRTLLGVVVLCLVIGWIPTISNNAHIGMMRIPGLQGSGLLLMMATYIVGRLIREFDLGNKGSMLAWLICFSGCVFALAMPCGRLLISNGYASPFVIITATCGFVAFLHLPAGLGGVGKLVNLISPSMFGVYILHECCIKKFQYLPPPPP